MLKIQFKLVINSITFTALASFASFSNAHDAGAAMGESASFTGYALVTCANEGSNPTDYLEISVQDTSPPVPGLLVNMQVIKGDRAANTTDIVSGDSQFSPAVRVHGGNGNYQILVNKTGQGPRSFIVSYHCKTATDSHSDTEILVKQFE